MSSSQQNPESMPGYDSLRQYTDLYDNNRELIDRGSAPALNARRDQARRALDGARLPRRSDEGFERTDINAMYAADRGLNISRLAMPADVAGAFRCGVPNLSTLMGVVVNDTFHPTRALDTRLPEGVIFGSLRSVALEDPGLIGRYYGTVAPADIPAVALNTMLAQDGVVVYVPEGVRLERPLQLVNLFAADFPLMAVRRVLIVLGRGASAQILACDHTSAADVDFLSSQVVEIILEQGSALDYVDLEETTASTGRYSQTFVRQEEGSTLRLTGVTLSGGTTRNDFNIDLTGEHCETHIGGIAVGAASQHIDNCSNVRHLSPRCHSRQLFKYALDDSSTGAFEGGILVTPGARFTEAYQSNRNVLASTEARMHSKPQLEIYNDDVKCSHGATTGQLDAEALFYMRTRGIPEAQARIMLMQAFMSDVIDGVAIDGLRDRLRLLVEHRFNRERVSCAECSRFAGNNG